MSSLVADLHRLLDWAGSVARRRMTTYVMISAVAAYGLVLRCVGIGRSLWLDEAWVANSVDARSLAGMFYYDAWLQSSPPLFLVLTRVFITAFGISNTVLRLGPLVMGILAVLSMFLFSTRFLSRQYALLAWVLLVLSHFAIHFSSTLKQYSSELAATATILFVCVLYVEKATASRFWLLVATVSVSLLAAYAVAFLLPGIALMIYIFPIWHANGPNAAAGFSRPVRRLILFTIITGGILLSEYYVFVVPNSPAVLRSEWAKKNAGVESFARLTEDDSYALIRQLPLDDRLLRKHKTVVGITGLTVMMGFALALDRFRKGRPKWLGMEVVCLTPCLLLIMSDWFSWYPFTERTSLFALPCLIALLVTSLRLTSPLVLKKRRDWKQPTLNVLMLAATLITVITVVQDRANFARLSETVEDLDGAVSFLHQHVQSRDFLWVHASCSEGFKLYAKMEGWQDPPAHYGHTGWPCCARGVANTKDTSSELLVRSDFGSALPSDFSGKVWLLYTTRVEHWRGMANEPQIMLNILSERGCVKTATPAFQNIGISSFDCKAAGEKLGLAGVPAKSKNFQECKFCVLGGLICMPHGNLEFRAANVLDSIGFLRGYKK